MKKNARFQYLVAETDYLMFRQSSFNVELQNNQQLMQRLTSQMVSMVNSLKRTTYGLRMMVSMFQSSSNGGHKTVSTVWVCFNFSVPLSYFGRSYMLIWNSTTSSLFGCMQDVQVSAEVLSNDDVLGDAIPPEQQEALRRLCYDSLKLRAGVWKTYLRQRNYYATWKADGMRYMMLITPDGCFLIDTNFIFRRVQMRFPMKQTSEGLVKDTHDFTLLDGEMVIDSVPDTQQQERRYLIYDLMAINSESIIELPFCERWRMLEKEVIEPRNLERQHMYNSRNPHYRYDLEPFRVRRKGFWLLSTVTKLIGLIPQLSHEALGLVFQGWDDPYVPRTNVGLLEWKYPGMNSVDFLFEVVDENRQLLYLYDLGRKKLMDGNRVDLKNGEDPSELSGKIIECAWDSEEQVWNCMRVRVDKSTPNDINTYSKVMQNIKDNIRVVDLLEEIGEIVCLPMYADLIRNDRN
ncbi:hypothetical protein MKW94_013795, partial [Papaver nudicaule]|nr:hypothetical protein [Papaver nudicaule]